MRASLRPFTYDTNGSKGVSFALQNLQKLRDGERIDGRLRPEDEFEAIERWCGRRRRPARLRRVGQPGRTGGER